MKKLIILILASTLLLGFESCKKEGCTDFDAANYDSEADTDDGTCIYNGQNVFWTDADYGVGTIDVYVDDVFQGTITSYMSSGIPDCGDDGFVTFEGAPGTYDFTAESEDGTRVWESTITIEEKTCRSMKLYVGSKSECEALIKFGTQQPKGNCGLLKTK